VLLNKELGSIRKKYIIVSCERKLTQCLSRINDTFIRELMYQYAPNCIRNKKVKVKVKGTLVQALRLCTGRTAHRDSRGIAVLFYDHSTRRG